MELQVKVFFERSNEEDEKKSDKILSVINKICHDEGLLRKVIGEYQDHFDINFVEKPPILRNLITQKNKIEKQISKIKKGEIELNHKGEIRE